MSDQDRIEDDPLLAEAFGQEAPTDEVETPAEGAQPEEAETPLTEAAAEERDPPALSQEQHQEREETPPQPEKPAEHIPLATALDWRSERDEAKRRLAEFERQQAQQQAQKQEQPAPDAYDDPQGFLTHGVTQAVQPINAKMAMIDRKLAMIDHTPEVVRAAEQAVRDAYGRGDIGDAESNLITSADNPYSAMVEWHKRQTLNSQLSEYGGDLDKLINARVEERLKANPPAQQQAAPQEQAKIPKSLQTARGGSAAPEQTVRSEADNDPLVQYVYKPKS